MNIERLENNRKEKTVSLPCAADVVIPIKPPMLLIKTLLTIGETENDWSAVEAVVPEQGPFIHEGRVMPEYFVELMAQGAAAIEGYAALNRNQQKNDIGFLVGIEKIVLNGQAMPAQVLLIRLRKTFSFESAHIFEGIVQNDTRELSKGSIRVWR